MYFQRINNKFVVSILVFLIVFLLLCWFWNDILEVYNFLDFSYLGYLRRNWSIVSIHCWWDILVLIKSVKNVCFCTSWRRKYFLMDTDSSHMTVLTPKCTLDTDKLASDGLRLSEVPVEEHWHEWLHRDVVRTGTAYSRPGWRVFEPAAGFQRRTFSFDLYERWLKPNVPINM